MKTRFSPSPTGQMHLGNVRTALFSFLLAKNTNGQFLLRIEDTDQVRSRKEFSDLLQDDLRWLGILWDEGPFWQSERHAIYDEYYSLLEQHKNVYPCFCSDEELALSRKIQISQSLPPRYAGTCRQLTAEQIQQKRDKGPKPTLRFKVPVGQEVHFHDLVKGIQRFRTDDIGDFIIRRADGTASFFFCNAIDDAVMGVTHAIRGEDHLTNTPRQILILSALRLPLPAYGHIALILGNDGTPLSKRNGSSSLHSLHEEGYLAIAVNNYLARLSHYYEQTHLMSLDELAAHFSINHLGKTAAHFDKAQLLHWQKTAVNQMSNDNFWYWLHEGTRHLVSDHKKQIFIDTVKPNTVFPRDADRWANILLGPLQINDPELALLKYMGKDFLLAVLHAIETHGAVYSDVIQAIQQKLNLKGKALFQPLRIALTGQTHGPELLGIFALLDKQGLEARLRDALSLL
jgi:glutamyl-tRNA synthetase